MSDPFLDDSDDLDDSYWESYDESTDAADVLVYFACASSAKRRKARVELPSSRTGLWERDILSSTR